MDRRIGMVLAAGVVIAAVCAWRVWLDPRDNGTARANRSIRLPAPGFTLRDTDNRRVSLDRYRGRHRILLVFFDGETGWQTDPLLRELADRSDEIGDLRRGEVVVFGISGALPQQNRAGIEAVGDPGFPLLTDPPPMLTTQREYGAFDAETNRTRPTIFLIERDGLIDWDANVTAPKPIDRERARRLLGL